MTPGGQSGEDLAALRCFGRGIAINRPPSLTETPVPGDDSDVPASGDATGGGPGSIAVEGGD